MTTDPTPTTDTGPTTDLVPTARANSTEPRPGEPVTAEQWHEAARRAFRRDRAILEDAYSAIDMTDDVAKLFAAAIWNLGRDHILTLAALPTRLAAARPNTTHLDPRARRQATP